MFNMRKHAGNGIKNMVQDFFISVEKSWENVEDYNSVARKGVTVNALSGGQYYGQFLDQLITNLEKLHGNEYAQELIATIEDDLKAVPVKQKIDNANAKANNVDEYLKNFTHVLVNIKEKELNLNREEKAKNFKKFDFLILLLDSYQEYRANTRTEGVNINNTATGLSNVLYTLARVTEKLLNMPLSSDDKMVDPKKVEQVTSAISGAIESTLMNSTLFDDKYNKGDEQSEDKESVTTNVSVENKKLTESDQGSKRQDFFEKYCEFVLSDINEYVRDQYNKSNFNKAVNTLESNTFMLTNNLLATSVFVSQMSEKRLDKAQKKGLDSVRLDLFHVYEQVLLEAYADAHIIAEAIALESSQTNQGAINIAQSKQAKNYDQSDFISKRFTVNEYADVHERIGMPTNNPFVNSDQSMLETNPKGNDDKSSAMEKSLASHTHKSLQLEETKAGRGKYTQKQFTELKRPELINNDLVRAIYRLQLEQELAHLNLDDNKLKECVLAAEKNFNQRHPIKQDHTNEHYLKYFSSDKDKAQDKAENLVKACELMYGIEACISSIKTLTESLGSIWWVKTRKADLQSVIKLLEESTNKVEEYIKEASMDKGLASNEVTKFLSQRLLGIKANLPKELTQELEKKVDEIDDNEDTFIRNVNNFYQSSRKLAGLIGKTDLEFTKESNITAPYQGTTLNAQPLSAVNLILLEIQRLSYELKMDHSQLEILQAKLGQLTEIVRHNKEYTQTAIDELKSAQNLLNGEITDESKTKIQEKLQEVINALNNQKNIIEDTRTLETDLGVTTNSIGQIQSNIESKASAALDVISEIQKEQEIFPTEEEEDRHNENENFKQLAEQVTEENTKLQKELKSKTKKLKELNDQNEKQRKEIQGLKDQQRELEAEKIELKQNVKDLEAAQTQLSDELTVKTEEVESLDAQVQESNGKVKNLEESMDILEKRRKALEQESNTNKEEIERITEQIESVKKEKEAESEKNIKLELEKDSAQNQLADKAKELKNIELKLGETEREYKGVRDENASLETKLSDTKAKYKTTLGAKDEEISRQQSEIEEQAQKSKEMQDEFDRYKAEVEKKIEAKTQKNKAIQGEFDEYKAEIAAGKTIQNINKMLSENSQYVEKENACQEGMDNIKVLLERVQKHSGLEDENTKNLLQSYIKNHFFDSNNDLKTMTATEYENQFERLANLLDVIVGSDKVSDGFKESYRNSRSNLSNNDARLFFKKSVAQFITDKKSLESLGKKGLSDEEKIDLDSIKEKLQDKENNTNPFSEISQNTLTKKELETLQKVQERFSQKGDESGASGDKRESDKSRDLGDGGENDDIHNLIKQKIKTDLINNNHSFKLGFGRSAHKIKIQDANGVDKEIMVPKRVKMLYEGKNLDSNERLSEDEMRDISLKASIHGSGSWWLTDHSTNEYVLNLFETIDKPKGDQPNNEIRDTGPQ